MDSTQLLALADRLESEGNLELAVLARSDAATPVPALRTPVTVRCDSCQKPIRSAARIAKYCDEYNLDWALCSRCEAREG